MIVGSASLPGTRGRSTAKCGNVNVWSVASWLWISSRRTSPVFTVIVGFDGVPVEPTCHSTADATRTRFTSAADAGAATHGARRRTTAATGMARRILMRPRTRPALPVYLRVSPEHARIVGRAKPLYGAFASARPRMSWTQQEIRELKVNRYVLIDEEPCRILSIQMSKPGKHGEAKARMEVVGLFDGQKRSIVHPVTHKVRVPLIDKKKAQVLSVHGNQAQLMDLGSYETFDLDVPPEFAGALNPGDEVLYMETMGRRKISKP